jgi:DNA-binding transcriptional MerR regulator
MTTKNLQGKMYYSISEAAEMVGVEAYVLRFWEKEFAHLKPKKNRAGKRMYKPEDIQRVTRIKRLLHDEGYTIEGVRKLLRKEGRSAGSDPAAQKARKTFGDIRKEINKILKLLP